MPMHPTAILHEVQQLYNVSNRLDSLAEQHPIVSEALLTISGSVRNTAALVGGVGRDENSAGHGIRSSKCLICSMLCFEPGVGILVRKLIVKNDVEK